MAILSKAKPMVLIPVKTAFRDSCSSNSSPKSDRG